MEEPWKVYHDELRDRAVEIVQQEWNVEEDLREAAHEAYAATADRLVNQLDWDEEDALALTRAFGRALRSWIGLGHFDWDDLIERLEAAQMEWEGSRQVSSI